MALSLSLFLRPARPEEAPIAYGLIPARPEDSWRRPPVGYAVLALRNCVYLGTVIWLGQMIYRRARQGKENDAGSRC